MSGTIPLLRVLTSITLAEFTDHQRNVFCVFSGQGVVGLRRYLNSEAVFAGLHDDGYNPMMLPRAGELGNEAPEFALGPAGHQHNQADGAFEEQEVDAVDDDDGPDDGSEMAIDPQPQGGGPANIPPPPPPPPASVLMPLILTDYTGHRRQSQSAGHTTRPNTQFRDDELQQGGPGETDGEAGRPADAMEFTPGGPPNAATYLHFDHRLHTNLGASRNHAPLASGSTASPAEVSTAPIPIQGQRRRREATPYVDGDASPSSNDGSPDGT